MMAKIRVDIEMLRSNSLSLTTKIEELTALNERLNGLILRIGASWEGEASAAYMAMMQSYASQAANMVNVLAEFKSYVDSAVTKFEAVDKNSAVAIRSSF